MVNLEQVNMDFASRKKGLGVEEDYNEMNNATYDLVENLGRPRKVRHIDVNTNTISSITEESISFTSNIVEESNDFRILIVDD